MFKILLKLKRPVIGKLLFIAFFVFLGSVYLIYLYNRPARLEVNFLDVGQGDAIFIKTPYGQNILIDGGPDNKVLRRLGEVLPYYDRKIDFILISHYHDDHAVGLVEIAKRYKVGRLIYASGLKSSAAVTELLEYVNRDKNKKERIPDFSLDGQTSLALGSSCKLDLINPNILGVKEDGNNSLVGRLDCWGQSFLFTGDNSAVVEKALIKSGWPLESLLFKASHHGSNSANTVDFLQVIRPSLLVISVGYGNKFGHPHPKVLERAKALGLKIRRTDQEGNLLIIGPKKPSHPGH